MKRVGLITSLLLCVCLVCPGCFWDDWFGGDKNSDIAPTGLTIPLEPLSSSKDNKVLASYKNFEIGEIQDGFAGHVPPQIFSLLPIKFKEHCAKMKLPNQPGGKTLIARGVILGYESADMTGRPFGPFEEVIVRMELVDKSTGKVLGTANCIGRTTKSEDEGVDKKADGLAKSIAQWISDYYPSEGR